MSAGLRISCHEVLDEPNMTMGGGVTDSEVVTKEVAYSTATAGQCLFTGTQLNSTLIWLGNAFTFGLLSNYDALLSTTSVNDNIVEARDR